ncbi:hypothetical protein [Halarchaeum acidiphilum]|uniref:hypothetical protein n=1 Tax=Halarchaeum acidiphilum TaxID=489138 RepID=UPI0011DCCF78|nr:hypothetical protein [Halarchaeum acidiphilum]
MTKVRDARRDVPADPKALVGAPNSHDDDASRSTRAPRSRRNARRALPARRRRRGPRTGPRRRCAPPRGRLRVARLSLRHDGCRPAAWLGLALGPLPLAATGLFWISAGPAPRGGVLLALVLAASGVVPLVVATAALARSGAAVIDVPRWLCVLPLVAAVLDLPVNLLLVHHLETPGLSLLGVTYLAFALAME